MEFTLPDQIRLPRELPRTEPLPVLDVTRARRETPGCEVTLHFNNAGAALMPEAVIEAVNSHLRLEADIGGYEAAERAEPALNRTYRAVAGLIGAQPDEIALSQSATRAWDAVFYAQPFEAGDRILTGTGEYDSNVMAMLQMARRRGVQVDVIANDETGAMSLPALQAAIDDRVKLIALTHVATNSAVVQPAAAVGRIARDAGVRYLLDASQTVGQMSISVADIGCDMLTVSGRKFLRAPRGTGFLYVRRALAEVLDPPFVDVGAAEFSGPGEYVLKPGAKRFESWEGYIAGRIALCIAVEYAQSWGIDLIAARIRLLAAAVRSQLAAVPGVTVIPAGPELCASVFFTVAGLEAHDATDRLRVQSINANVSRGGMDRVELDAHDPPRILRASVHYYNTEAEVERFCAAVAALR